MGQLFGQAGQSGGAATGFGAGNTANTPMPLWNPSGAGAPPTAAGGSGGQGGKGSGAGGLSSFGGGGGGQGGGAGMGSTIGSVGGGVLGTALGGPMGGMAGSAIGGELGGMGGGMIAPGAAAPPAQMNFSRGQPTPLTPFVSAQTAAPSLLTSGQGSSQQALQLRQLLQRFGIRQ